MNKRIITLGLLVGVLSLNSCVKDNESDVVQAQRQAQTEKLKAEAGKLMADKAYSEAQAKLQESLAKVQEANAKILEQQAVFDKAKADLEIALQTKKNEKEIAMSQVEIEKYAVQLEQQKVLLEEAKQQAWRDLEDLKLTVIKDRDEVAKALAEYQGTKEQEAIQVVSDKYSAYEMAVNALVNAQGDLFGLEKKLLDKENKVADLEAEKELAIERKKIQIEVFQERIEALKQVQGLSGEDFNTKVSKAKADYEAADNKASALLKDYRWWMDKRDRVSMDIVTNPEGLKFITAVRKLRQQYILNVIFGNIDFPNYEQHTISQDGQMVSYRVYNVDFVPVLYTEKKDVLVKKIDANIEAAKQEVDNQIADRDAKKADMEAKKTAYEADPTKEGEYLTALAAYEASVKTLTNKEKNLADAKKVKQELLGDIADYVNADYRKEYKDMLVELNKMGLKMAEAELKYDLQIAKRNILKAKWDDLRNNVDGVPEQILDLQEKIRAVEAEIADVQAIQNEKQWAERYKKQIESKKAQIELLKKLVEATKKAYEDALAAL